jgi:hypothetical protein
MRPPVHGRRVAAIAAALLWTQAAGADPALAPRATIHVEPREIEIGMLYRGARLHVEGTAPAGGGLAVVCAGKEARVELKRKGKVWNVLWMNVGSVTFDRVPSLYLVSAVPEPHSDRTVVPVSAELDPPRGVVIPADLRLAPGYDGIEAQVLTASDDDARRALFRELIRLKMGERLYAFGGDLRSDGPAGVAAPARFSADLALPANIPPGEYEVRLVEHQNGVGRVLATQTINARRVGLAHLIASMSERHGLLYGILSVILAILAGFSTGVVFASSKKGH